MMKYKKLINLLENAPNQTTKFRTKNWVETNDDSRRTYNTNSQIKFKTSMSGSSLCDYSDAYILVKGTVIVTNTGTEAAPNNRDKKAIFKNYAPFIDCISETNNTELDHARDIDVVMPMYNLIEYSDNYLKASGSLWQYYRDEPILNNDDNIVDFPGDPDSVSFKYTDKITGETEDNGRKDVQIIEICKYLINLKTIELFK